MKFQNKFKSLIFSGEKDCTTRLHKKPEYETNKTYTIDVVVFDPLNQRTDTEFAGYLTIVRSVVWPLGILLHDSGFPVFPWGMDGKEFVRREGFRTLDEFIGFFRKMYPATFKKIKVATTYQFEVVK